MTDPIIGNAQKVGFEFAGQPKLVSSKEFQPFGEPRPACTVIDRFDAVIGSAAEALDQLDENGARICLVALDIAHPCCGPL